MLVSLFIAGCLLDSSDSSEGAGYHAKFFANGTYYDFEMDLGGGFAMVSGKYECTWDTYRYWNSDITLTLPSTVATGYTYSETNTTGSSSHACILSYANESGDLFSNSMGAASLSIVITQWGGPGGLATGTFSGTIRGGYSGSQTVTIAEGSFSAYIDKY